MSVFVLDASYTFTWCFPDRATAKTGAALQRMEVPWIWQVEVGNALGKAVVKGKVPLARAREIWDELLLLPIRQVAIGNIPQLLGMAVQHNLSLYDTCYLQASLVSKLPLATNDQKLASGGGSQRDHGTRALKGDSMTVTAAVAYLENAGAIHGS